MKKAVTIICKTFIWLIVMPMYLLMQIFALMATFRWTIFFGIGILIPLLLIALYIPPIIFRREIKGGFTMGFFYATIICLVLSFALYFFSHFVGISMPVFGFTRSDFDVVLETDSHGGFHGDGKYCLVLDCSDNKKKAYRNLKKWSEFPLPEELEIIAYGGEYNGENYSSMFSDEMNLPKITNGYYYFKNRSHHVEDSKDISGIHDAGSYNFDFAIYDADTDMLYGIMDDT